MVEELPNGIRKTFKNKLTSKKIKIAEMVHETSRDLAEKRIVYRLVLAGKHEKNKKEEYITAFVVKGYENAILVQLGKTIGVLNEGIYEIDKGFQYTGTEIIWVGKTEFKTKWGLPEVYLKDNIKISVHGSLLIRITDPISFVLNVVSGKQTVTRKDVDDFIFDTVVETYRQVLGGFKIDEVIRSRDEIKRLVQAKIFDLLSHWGIELINLEIEGMKLPKEFEELGKIAMEKHLEKEKKAHAKETMIEDLEMEKLKTNRKKLDLQKEKQKMREEIELVKFKREITAEEREIVRDKKSFDREQSVLDAQTEYETTKYDSKAQKLQGEVQAEVIGKKEVAKVAGEVELVKTQGVTNTQLTKLEAERDVQIAQAKAGVKTKDKKGRSSKQEELIQEKINELKEKLEKFDILLTEGKISENIYKMRITRIEKELKTLENKLI